MRVIRLLALSISIVITLLLVSSCQGLSDSQDFRPIQKYNSIKDDEKIMAMELLKSWIDNYDVNPQVSYRVYVNSDGINSEVIYGVWTRNKVLSLQMMSSIERKKIGYLESYFQDNVLYIVPYKDKLAKLDFYECNVKDVKTYNGWRNYISEIYDSNVDGMNKLFDLVLNYDSIIEVTRGETTDVTGTTNFYEYKFEVVQSSPITSLVIDNCDVELNNDYFVVDLYENNLLAIKTKVIYNNQEHIILMGLECCDSKGSGEVALDYIKDKNAISFSNGWPEEYKLFFKDILKTSDIPMPVDMSEYNEIWKEGQSCFIANFLSTEGFLENYSDLLLQNGFSFSKNGKLYQKVIKDEKGNNNRITIRFTSMGDTDIIEMYAF